MTRQEFEQQYADNAGVTTDTLRKLGLRAVLCSCKEDDCLGWRMQSFSERDSKEV